jgi:hypothetical protein
MCFSLATNTSAPPTKPQMKTLSILLLFAVTLSCQLFLVASSTSYSYTGNSWCTCHELNGTVCVEWSCYSDLSPQGTSCFWADSRVTLESGETIPISQLKVGDRVETALPDGTIVFDEFYGWLDIDRTKKTTFLRIHLASPSGSSEDFITMTPDHLIFVAPEGADSMFEGEEELQVAFAGQVTVGSYVWRKVGSGSRARMVPAQVKAITVHELEGAFGPGTRSGSLLVDGVLASNYAIVLFPQNVLHNIVFKPLHVLHDIWGTSSPEEGIHWYPRMLNNLFVNSGILSYIMPDRFSPKVVHVSP